MDIFAFGLTTSMALNRAHTSAEVAEAAKL